MGLDEELKELDYQLKHGEITRPLYTRSRSRLQLLRRFVQRIAKEQDEDRVPEVEVLTADELGTLGLPTRPNAQELQVGVRLGDRWTVLAIEPGRPQFFIFERVSQPVQAADDDSAGKHLDLAKIIETVIVEHPVVAAPPSGAAAPGPTTEVEMPSERPRQTMAAPRIDGPRVLRFYLPSYSQQARAKGIEGDLVVSAIFKREGKIKDIAVEEGLGHGLDERAREAVRQTEFEPAIIDQQPADVRVRVVFNFSLLRVTVRIREAERINEVRQ